MLTLRQFAWQFPVFCFNSQYVIWWLNKTIFILTFTYWKVVFFIDLDISVNFAYSVNFLWKKVESIISILSPVYLLVSSSALELKTDDKITDCESCYRQYTVSLTEYCVRNTFSVSPREDILSNFDCSHRQTGFDAAGTYVQFVYDIFSAPIGWHRTSYTNNGIW